jgi:hypothetical protein
LFIEQIHLDAFKRVYDKKLAILVICKIFMMREAMPASLSGLIKPLFAASIALFAKFPAAVEERKKCITMHIDDEELDESTFGDDFGDDFQDLDDEEEGIVDEEKEAKYVALLQKHAAERAANHNDDEDDFDEDEDEWGVPPIEEDPYFFTGLRKRVNG